MPVSGNTRKLSLCPERLLSQLSRAPKGPFNSMALKACDRGVFGEEGVSAVVHMYNVYGIVGIDELVNGEYGQC